MAGTFQSWTIWLCLMMCIDTFVLLDAKVTCRDNNNNFVDWFAVYKIPRIRNHSNPDIRQGLGFYYIDETKQTWTLGPQNINQTAQAVYNTLQQIYDNHNSKYVAYILYNDETPEKHVSDDHGHTKGSVAFDKSTGFWLVHSVPRFPPYVNSSYSYPKSGEPYGQTLLCVTYNYNMFNVIGGQLLYNYPQVYDHNLPDSFVTNNQNLLSVINNNRSRSAPYYKVKNLTSVNGKTFTSFAKCDKFDADLYHDLVAVYYRSDLLAETWLLGPGKLPSNCTGQYKVNNIHDMRIVGVGFKSTKDHSKWAVSRNGTVTCIGDINREHAQLTRDGGTVCFVIPCVWTAFHSSVSLVEPCPQTELS